MPPRVIKCAGEVVGPLVIEDVSIETNGVGLRVLMWAVLGAVGCGGPVELWEVPVSGGTDSERALVREEMLRFERWVGPGRVKVREVAIVDTLDEVHGMYFSKSKRVEIVANLSPLRLKSVLRHELCHALELEENLMWERNQWHLDRFIGDEQARLEQWVAEPFQLYSEAFAQVCEFGPTLTRVLSARCPFDEERVQGAAAWVNSVAFTGEQEVVQARLHTKPPLYLDLGRGPVRSVSAWGMERQTAATILVYFEGEGADRATLAVDLVTGEVGLNLSQAPVNMEGRGGLVAQMPTGILAPESSEASYHHGQQTLVIGEPWAAKLGSLVPRLWVRTGEQWALSDVCVPKGSSVVFANNRWFIVSPYGQSVQWTEVVLEP